MKRNENESFEDYKERRRSAKLELKEKRKGVYKTYTRIDDNGKETEIPIMHSGAKNRRSRRDRGSRLFSNKKGIQLVVVGNTKYMKVVQRIPADMKYNKNYLEESKMYVTIPGKAITHSLPVPLKHSGKTQQLKAS